MNKIIKVEVKKERVILAEIFKEDGKLGIAFPNSSMISGFELYGFLKIYVENLQIDLEADLEGLHVEP